MAEEEVKPLTPDELAKAAFAVCYSGKSSAMHQFLYPFSHPFSHTRQPPNVSCYSIHDDDLITLYELMAGRPDQFKMFGDDNEDLDLFVNFPVTIDKDSLTVVITEVVLDANMRLIVNVLPYEDPATCAKVNPKTHNYNFSAWLASNITTEQRGEWVAYTPFIELGTVLKMRLQEAAFVASMKKSLPYLLLRLKKVQSTQKAEETQGDS